jgi:hypothetical protein
MYDTFRGKLSGHGLSTVGMDVQLEAEAEVEDGTVGSYRGRFISTATHPFAAGQQYRLDLDRDHVYTIEITEADGQQPRAAIPAQPDASEVGVADMPHAVLDHLVAYNVTVHAGASGRYRGNSTLVEPVPELAVLLTQLGASPQELLAGGP